MVNKKYQKKVARRTFFVAFIAVVWFSLVVFRLVQLQVIHHPELKSRVETQSRNMGIIPPKRGTIYDRSGNIFARSVPCQSVYYISSKEEPFSHQVEKIRQLQNVLNLSAQQVKNISQRIKKNQSFIWVQRKIEDSAYAAVKKMDIEGIHFTEEMKRIYPHGDLASHLIGRVDIDGIGISGVEQEYNDLLMGKAGKRINLLDAKRREYQFEILEKPHPGQDLTLTIDETIQYIAQYELQKTVRETRAKWGTMIVSHPASGEILAMASCPEYNLNQPLQSVSQLRQNRTIHYLINPGSTFKIVTFAAAIETGAVQENESFDCRGKSIKVGYKTFHDHKPMDILTFPEVFSNSSNVGTIQIGQRISQEKFYHMIQAFGFGRATGIDLPAEERGIVHPFKDWERNSWAFLSIGYEISVTPLQILQAMNVIANRGVLVAPRITGSFTQEMDAYKDEISGKRVISESTALILTEYMKKAVREGTGTNAGLDEYSVAGKTGTAQKLDRISGAYSAQSHISSFIGFFPSDQPLLSISAVIDEPQGGFYGSEIAAPLYKRAASGIARYLGYPSNPLSMRMILAATNKKPETHEY
jgi:cell division protein FtsI/penicillin-binding protein 2